MKLYLAHPILDRAWVREYELKIEKEFDIELDNPFYDGKERGDIKGIDAGTVAPYDISLDFNDLATGDLEAIDSSDGLLAVVTASPSIGTYMEIFYNARILKRPTYIVILNDQFRTHPWLRFCATQRFFDMISFIGFLPNIGVKKR
jgi:hypothetical protein